MSQPVVRLPAQAVDAQGQDLATPTEELLKRLLLLGDPNAGQGLGAAFAGPPQSVAVIEAGATAAAKWWSTGLAGSVAVVWGAITKFWGNQDHDTQRMVLLVAGIATAAAVLAIGYLLGSDVRGRAQAATATIEARAQICDTLLALSEAVYKAPAPAAAAEPMVALPAPLEVVHVTKPAADERGWRAIAFRLEADGTQTFLVVKGGASELVKASELEFV